jgi:hypothetical protein
METINEYFAGIACIAAESASKKKGLCNINWRWIYCQFAHETGLFTSELQASNHNLGGLTQEEENDTPQPDGPYYYMNFNTFEEYGDYFGRYLGYYVSDGIDQATTLEEYIIALKKGKYFSDSLETYIRRCREIYTDCFGE